LPSPFGSSGDPVRRGERSRLVGAGALMGGAGNLLLMAAKLAGGYLFSSEALIADGVHSASDVAAAVAVGVGIRISRLPADRDHPYGHEKAEVIAQNIVGILLILAGIGLLVQSALTLRSGRAPMPGWVALWIATGSLILKELLFIQNSTVGRRFCSLAMLALAKDHRVDVWASLIAAIGILGARAGVTALDPLGGAAVALLVIRAGWELVVRSTEDLMDEFDDPSTLRTLRTTVASVSDVRRIEGIRARRMGGSILVDVEIAVDGDLTVRRGHQVAGRVKDALEGLELEVEAVHVHVDPDPPEGGGEEADRAET